MRWSNAQRRVCTRFPGRFTKVNGQTGQAVHEANLNSVKIKGGNYFLYLFLISRNLKNKEHIL